MHCIVQPNINSIALLNKLVKQLTNSRQSNGTIYITPSNSVYILKNSHRKPLKLSVLNNYSGNFEIILTHS